MNPLFHQIIRQARINLNRSLAKSALERGDYKKADEHILRMMQIEKENVS